MKKHTCALVLAAGFSKRYGSDKRFSGLEPLVLRTLKNVISSFDNIYLVHRNSDEKIITLLKDLPVTLIKAPSDDICLGTSISTGIKHIKKHQQIYESCAVFLADMPYIKKETIYKLKSIQSNNSIVRPTFAKKPGHPVIFGSDFFDELTEISGKEGANSVIKKHLAYLNILDVQDSGVIKDIDYPE